MDTIVAVLTIIAGTAGMLGGLGAWLWSRFSSIYSLIERNRNNADANFSMIKEALDNKHSENRDALEKIRLCLARAGLWNGHASSK